MRFLTSSVLLFAILSTGVRPEALASSSSHPNPCAFAASEVASWSSVDPVVIDYTNELIRLNPSAQMIIVGRKVTLTSTPGTSLRKPAGEVPNGVYFYKID